MFILCCSIVFKLPVKVISVGNLTWGGNGKTSMVEFLARWFDASWISPLVLSRISEQKLYNIQSTIREMKDPLPVFFTRMAPCYFATVEEIDTRIPLTAAQGKIFLCVFAIGSPDGFVNCIEKLGALYVDRIDFSDHHMIQAKDVNWIKDISNQLWNKHKVKPVIVVTEKDNDRDQESLRGLHPFDVFILCSRLEFLLRKGHSEVDFKKLVEQLLEMKTKKLSDSFYAGG
ncbi:hypothetical protein Drorol1_Dr00020023 [Drosera rotundifolia]